MNFVPHTPEDIQKALEKVGVSSLEALFADLPEALRDPDIDLGPGLDEVSLMRHMRQLAAKNTPAEANFLGGGVRQHFIPSVTPKLAMQSEFVTAYTPYQPEVAQGLLQATFEYQTMMTELTGLEVSNASLYDGATAVAEAALLAMRHTKREKVIVSQGVHPEAREVLATYARPLGAEIVEVALEALRTPDIAVTEDTACVIAQTPNFLGYLEDMAPLAEAAHRTGALFVASVDPLSLALLKPPASYGADIAVGDGQVLGNPSNFGGPSFGFMVVKQALLRQLPGRLVGETQGADGKRTFVLTLQAREQHIRRSKAKSNICTNHQLTALMAAVNLAALGPQGLKDIATASVQQAHTLAELLDGAGVQVHLKARFFNEFTISSPVPARTLRRALAQKGIHAGVPVPKSYGLGDATLLSASEQTRDEDIDQLVSALTALTQDAKPLAEAAHD